MLKTLVGADKINVAAIGNVVAQLHVHVIASFATDPAWPAAVWGQAPARAYAADEAAQMLQRITGALQALGTEAASGSNKARPGDSVAASWRPLAP